MAMTTSNELEQEEGEFIDYYRWCKHTNLKTILFMSKTKILFYIKERQDSIDDSYQTCIKGKMTKTAIPKRSHTGTHKPSEWIFSNLCNPMQTCSIQGNTYIMTYLNHKTKWIHVKFLSKKLQQLKKFKAYQVAFKRRYGIKVKCLRTKKRSEYTSRKAQEYLKE